MAPAFECDSRDVNLLATTLNIFESVFDDLAGNTPKGDVKTTHLHLQVYSRLASEQLNRLKNANIRVDGRLVYELLDKCNSLVEETVFKATSDVKPYGSLISLQGRWAEVSLENKNAKFSFSIRFGSTERAEEVDVKSENPFRQKKGKLTDTLMDTYSHLKTQYPDSLLVDDQLMPKKTTRLSPPYPVWRVAESIFEALMASRKRPCSCSPSHQYDTSLRLATHRVPRNASSYPEFDIFLGLDRTWQEITIQVVKKAAVKFQADEKFGCDTQEKKRHQKLSQPRSRVKRLKVNRLCEPLRDMRFWKSHLLKLEVEESKLYHLKQTPPDTSTFLLDHSKTTISFEEFIRSKGSRLTNKTKRIVAVLLAHAVLNLQGTNWMRPSWRSSEVVFYQYSSVVPLRPYIQISLADSPTDCPVDRVEPPDESIDDSDEDDDEEFSLHPFPCLVTLAIMLMELYFCHPFEEIAEEYLDGVSIDMINANIGYLDGVELNEQELRDVIYDQIVRRLENELEGHWVNEHFITNLDDESQYLDLANWGQPLPDGKRTAGQERKTRPRWNSEGAMLSADTSRATTPHESTCVPIIPGRYTQRMRPRNSLNLGGRSTRQRPDYRKASRDDFLDWKQQLLEVYDAFIRGSESPVKIAILDTGIDLTHPDFGPGMPNRTRIIKVKNFTDIVECFGEENVHDENGHGTHAAGLILDFAPDAELYVAKIGRDEPSSPIVVANAIDFAVTEWKVDIISMSFGWPTQDVPGYETLKASIRDAYSKTLLFAAASNEGANRRRAFPARQREVICIHATDANGQPSRFNPSNLQDDNNFATMGEAIESAWPKLLCLESNDAYIAYRTGTSFATPIAAGIAAFLIQYGKENLGETENK
ncbi:hypothetical protein AJ80_09809 [Polytolypa hystricis UAMH7299]|uniref:Uncharacterized protein n=1 Tax=Polytolypa hystricis (strain UAMH7299) TaxID=1447883 RepID=A0A2B7WJ94_POLH7|nr:hypothetical protein AJ80_09809 [Polytolypa hystricis UAMH7299]